MFCVRVLLLMAVFVFPVFAQIVIVWDPAKPVPDSCPIEKRSVSPYIPPPPFDQENLPRYSFWFGNDRLFTVLNDDMIWEWRPLTAGHENDLTNKIFWYHAGYDPRLDPSPKMTVTGRRLDGPSPSLRIDRATNVLGEEGTGAILTGIYIPAPGCWELTGTYGGKSLSFVVWVTPDKLTLKQMRLSAFR